VSLSAQFDMSRTPIREALVRRREELQRACDVARERMNQNAGAVAAYDEMIAALDAEPSASGNGQASGPHLVPTTEEAAHA